jgi:hypothetical protein
VKVSTGFICLTTDIMNMLKTFRITGDMYSLLDQ